MAATGNTRSESAFHALVVGGAGYIGSHMVKRLARAGHRVTTLDNLSQGHRDAVLHGELIVADLLDRSALERVFDHRRFDVVIHCAGVIAVGESMVNPRKHYANNLTATLNLLDAMLGQAVDGRGEPRVDKLLFSSTAATYGLPRETPITEHHPQLPVNPYGNTKLAVERVLADYGRAYGMASVALRYFNAAGADREGQLRERHEPETHLIPLVLREAARVRAGGDRKASTLRVFGNDYPTTDGTCTRDYIHVEDLCDAHLLAAERLLADKVEGFEAMNLGNGQGATVLEVIEAARAATGVDFGYELGPRRDGDPPALVASCERAMRVLGYRPQVTRIQEIVASAYRASHG